MTPTRIAFIAAAAGLVAGPALANPNTSGTPLYGTINLNGGFTPDPRDIQVRAGGDTSVDTLSLPGHCTGHIVTGQPDIRLNFTPGSAPLRIASCADSDTSLIINDPSGTWHCNDDTEGTNPVVAFQSPRAGQYDIWVGTYAAGSSQPATVRISEFTDNICSRGTAATAAAPAAASSGMVTLSYTNPPRYGAIALAGGFQPDPHRVTVLAGGGTDVDNIANIPSTCAGHIATDRPDFRLNFTPGSLPLRIASCAGEDTTLVINDAQGNWHCNDDTEGRNPVVTIQNPPAGQFDIWVGTYGEGPPREAALTISERTGNLCGG